MLTGDGNDEVYSRLSNASLSVAGGTVLINAGPGTNDILDSNADIDMTIRDGSLGLGGTSNLFFSEISNSRLIGGDSGNTFRVGTFTGGIYMSGGGGDDFLFGGVNGDTIHGNAGDDTINDCFLPAAWGSIRCD